MKIEIVKDEIEATITVSGLKADDQPNRKALKSWGFRGNVRNDVFSYSPKNFDDAKDTMALLLGMAGITASYRRSAQ